MGRASSLTHPSAVGDLLTVAVPGLAERMLEVTIRAQWPHIVGPHLARRSRPGALRRGTLEVTTDNSPCLQELSLQSGDILGALSTRFPGAATALRFSIGPVAAARGTATRQRQQVPARLSDEDARLVESATSALTDPALAASVRRLIIKDLVARRQSTVSRPGAEPPAPKMEHS